MKRGDIVLVDLPELVSGTGHEQTGTRPSLIVHNDTTSQILSVIMMIPFTSRVSSQKFPHTIAVQPSVKNSLNAPYFLMIFQLRAIDKRRIVKKIGQLEESIMNQVDEEMKRLLGLSKGDVTHPFFLLGE